MENRIQRITPFLWFDDQAEEAAGFYISIFDDSRIVTVTQNDTEATAARAMEAMLRMKKIDIAGLKRAAEGREP